MEPEENAGKKWKKNPSEKKKGTQGHQLSRVKKLKIETMGDGEKNKLRLKRGIHRKEKLCDGGLSCP